MTVTILIPQACDPEDMVFFETLIYSPYLLEYNEYQELLHKIGPKSLLLEHLVVEYLNRGDTDSAARVLQDLEEPPLDLVRAVTILRAREHNKDVYPLSLPAEEWFSPHPHLFDESFYSLEWYAGRVEFIMEGEVTLRVRHCNEAVEKFGTLIVQEHKLPRPAKAGDYLEAVKVSGLWVVRFYDMEAPPIKNPFF